ncbi:PssD/Cps14F family polysaccharide biosynthesis glycosyltransferase [Chloroflexota bacterium]
MKICLVCSYGGHLAEMLRLTEAFEGHRIFLITYKERYTMALDDISKVYLIPRLIPNFSFKYLSRFLLLANMIITAVGELFMLLKERPHVIVSTGAEIAIPICYLAKFLRKKVVFIESICRINEPSGSAKIIYPVADLFLVQWESLLNKFPKARYSGRIM